MVWLLWKTVWQFLKKLNIINIRPSNSSARYVPKIVENMHLKKYLHINYPQKLWEYSTYKVETGQCPSVDLWMDKIYIPYN